MLSRIVNSMRQLGSKSVSLPVRAVPAPVIAPEKTEFQPRKKTPMELIAEQPIRETENEVVVCKGGFDDDPFYYGHPTQYIQMKTRAPHSVQHVITVVFAIVLRRVTDNVLRHFFNPDIWAVKIYQ
eukprot:597404_1